MKEYFEGRYFKHQKDDNTLCIIAGQTEEERFIQVITKNFSAEIPFTEGNLFSEKGIRLDIREPEFTLRGAIRYGELSPIKYDIMGPFSRLPMECRHGIISMGHTLEGRVCLNGETLDFSGGTGYMEKDSGYSFPSWYWWIQANDFRKPCSIMAAAAEIPLGRFHFRGCICVVQYQGKEYRFATYLGARIRICTPDRLLLTQGSYALFIRVKRAQAFALSAPQKGRMDRTIWECAACPAEFRLFRKGKEVFRFQTRHASFEWEPGE